MLYRSVAHVHGFHSLIRGRSYLIKKGTSLGVERRVLAYLKEGYEGEKSKGRPYSIELAFAFYTYQNQIFFDTN